MENTGGYSPKDLHFNEEARAKLIRGIEKISKAVKSTLGPMGNTVLIESTSHTHGITVTKDGVTVAKSVRDLQHIRDQAMMVGKFGDAIRAEELRLKATGLLINKSHVKHENVDAMTREQLLEKLGDFMKIAQQRMKDITPAQESEPLIVEDNTVQ